LNYLDRKKYDSIDEIKTKKDQEIKDLRQRFLKVSKDLRETKNKIEEKEKKKNPKERLPTGRRIKSSTLLGLAS
jgi:signal transduction histidine kinase